jgi:hypothetical protein
MSSSSELPKPVTVTSLARPATDIASMLITPAILSSGKVGWAT